MNHAQNPPHLPGGITQIMEALEIIEALTIMDSSTEMYAGAGDWVEKVRKTVLTYWYYDLLNISGYYTNWSTDMIFIFIMTQNIKIMLDIHQNSKFPLKYHN